MITEMLNEVENQTKEENAAVWENQTKLKLLVSENQTKSVN